MRGGKNRLTPGKVVQTASERERKRCRNTYKVGGADYLTPTSTHIKQKKMIWIRIVITLLVVLLVIYYAMLMLQIAGLLAFSKREITFSRAIKPFYYWIHTGEEPKHKKKSTNKK